MMMIQGHIPLSLEKKSCLHCGKTIDELSDEQFCCRGCAIAFSFIKHLGLTQYYTLRKNESSLISTDESIINENFDIFDNEEFQKDFVTYKNSVATAEIVIDRLQCYSCVWLCENVVNKLSSHSSLNVNYAKGTGIITFDRQYIKLSEIVYSLNKCGYSIQKKGLASFSLSQDLIRIGVGAFCTMNIMSFAFADYLSPASDMNENFWHLFRYLSLAFCTIAISYSAYPIIRTVLTTIRLRKAHIDQPIFFALIGPYLYSFYNTLRGQGEIYFDSISAIITLLLVGRFFQKKALEKAERSIASYFHPEAEFVKKITSENNEEIIKICDIKVGDCIRVFPGDIVPVNSVVIAGKGEVSFESITGEPNLVLVSPWESLRAGASICESSLVVKAMEDGGHGYITRIHKLAEKMLSGRSQFSQFASRLSVVYIILIIIFSALTLISYWSLSSEVAFARAAAVLLVACPCAFGMAVPLVFANCSGQAIKDGIIFRSPEAIENLANVKKVFFDKTGTLTFGKPMVSRSYIFFDQIKKLGLEEWELQQLLAPSVKVSSHHTLLALKKWSDDFFAKKTHLHQPLNIEYPHEEIGEGISYQYGQYKVKIGRLRYCSSQKPDFINEEALSANVFIAVDNQIVAAFWLTDTLRPQVKEGITLLKNLKKDIQLISGDLHKPTLEIARQIGLKDSQVISEVSPVQKVLSVRRNKEKIAMVGNGLNDSLAIAEADVGIAVFDATAQAKKMANICLMRDEFSLLPKAFSYSQAAIFRIRQIFIFSGIYNLVTVFMAMSGLITPLIAALLMPLNSLSVVFIAIRRL